MTWNKMRSTPSDRWSISKFEKSPIDNSAGNDLREIVPKNNWFLLVGDDSYAHVRCENCGYIFQLLKEPEKDNRLKNHDISDSGIVTPSIGHAPDHCGFHEWGFLEDWEQ